MSIKKRIHKKKIKAYPKKIIGGAVAEKSEPDAEKSEPDEEKKDVKEFKLASSQQDLLTKLNLCIFNGELVILSEYYIGTKGKFYGESKNANMGYLWNEGARLKKGYIIKSIKEIDGKEVNIDEFIKKAKDNPVAKLKHKKISELKCTKLDETKYQIIVLSGENTYNYFQSELLQNLKGKLKSEANLSKDDFNKRLEEMKISDLSLFTKPPSEPETKSEPEPGMIIYGLYDIPETNNKIEEMMKTINDKIDEKVNISEEINNEMIDRTIDDIITVINRQTNELKKKSHIAICSYGSEWVKLNSFFESLTSIPREVYKMIFKKGIGGVLLGLKDTAVDTKYYLTKTLPEEYKSYASSISTTASSIASSAYKIFDEKRRHRRYFLWEMEKDDNGTKVKPILSGGKSRRKLKKRVKSKYKKIVRRTHKRHNKI
jgi:hypothetical protein